jgi:protein TonB
MKKVTFSAKAPAITAADRFGFTLFVSAVINAVVVLGVTFAPNDPSDNEEIAPTLEVILVPTRSERAPDEADFLAQSSQIGSGEAEDKRRPSTPTPSPITTADTSSAPAFLPQLKAQPKPENLERELMTAHESDWEIPSRKQEQPEIPEIKTPTAAELVQRGEQIARLSAELSEMQEIYAKRPRNKFLSAANAKEYKYAAYITDWERKVEKVGSINFPDEAKRNNMKGDLILDVAIQPDGTIADVQIRRSSGNRVLDDAALRIVHLAAPFAAFPSAFRKEFDILHITRTWEFLPGGMLDTK